MAAIHGHLAPGVVDPIREMQLTAGELPDGERVIALEAFERRMRTVRRMLSAEVAQAVRTAYLAGFVDSRFHGAMVRAREARAAMDGGTSHVRATVTSRSAGPAGRRG